MKKVQAKHKLCRRLGYCVWNMPNCPTVKGKARTYAAGLQGKAAKRKKLSTYGEMMQEKQKLKAHYALTENQLRNSFLAAKRLEGKTNEVLMQRLESRLDAAVYHSGIAPTIFAAKQFVSHRHILVNGKIVDRGSYLLRVGDVITINAEKSPKVAEIAKEERTAPAYLEVDKEALKVVYARQPMIEEIPVRVESLRVVEYYAR
ncbi:MAG: 30S ribosomal protein S4 [Lentisphaeria bacterium]|nr:30S ribosomal protein S4 [Lentisphaeria bacterium]